MESPHGEQQGHASHGLASVEPRGRARRRSLQAPALPGSEGTASGPIEIAHDSTPYIGRVGGAAPSYYEITGLTPNQGYVLRLVTEEEGAVLEQWSEGFGGTALVNLVNGVGYATEKTFSSPTSSAFFTVSLSPEDDGFTAFALEIEPLE